MKNVLYESKFFGEMSENEFQQWSKTCKVSFS